MFKEIHAKLDTIIKNQEIQARMTADLIQTLDEKRFNHEQRKHAMDDYVAGITHMMQGSGAPPELIENFKTLFARSFAQ